MEKISHQIDINPSWSGGSRSNDNGTGDNAVGRLADLHFRPGKDLTSVTAQVPQQKASFV